MEAERGSPSEALARRVKRAIVAFVAVTYSVMEGLKIVPRQNRSEMKPEVK